MPANKNALQRYMIIIRELRMGTSTCPITVDELISKIEEEVGWCVSKSSIQKDIYALRYDESIGFHCPIEAHSGDIDMPYGLRLPGYWITRDWLLSEHIRKHWGI